MNAKNRLTWGILGCARISRRGLIPAIQSSASSSLMAIASRDGAKARAWSGEFGIPRWYDSYQRMLDDQTIDVMYIPLPNELHKPWVIAAANAGKHVLCEKPLACDADEAVAMVEHCRERGVLLMEAFMWRHQPRTLSLLRQVRDGLIGDLRLVRCSFSFSVARGDWRLDPARGGGALWDVGCYGVNAARLFASAEPTSIRALSHTHKLGVDASLIASLRFPGNLLALIDCSFEQPYRCCYELVGTRGVIDVPDAFLPPDQSVAICRGLGNDAAGGESEVRSFPGENQYAAMVDAFAASVRAGRLIDPAENGLAQMRVLDAIRAAARH